MVKTLHNVTNMTQNVVIVKNGNYTLKFKAPWYCVEIQLLL